MIRLRDRVVYNGTDDLAQTRAQWLRQFPGSKIHIDFFKRFENGEAATVVGGIDALGIVALTYNPHDISGWSISILVEYLELVTVYNTLAKRLDTE